VVLGAIVAMQRRGKHVSTTLEVLCFLRGPFRCVILKTVGATVQLGVQVWSVNQRATEAEESPLLRFVTRKHLVKTYRGIAIAESCYQVKTS
jgi:hypothetical protein